jgi:hypothetical protein
MLSDLGVFLLRAMAVVESSLRLPRRALQLSVEYMGTTVFAVCVGLLVFLLMEVYVWRKEGLESMKSRWRGSAGLGLLATVSIWILLFFFCIGKVIYDDHQIPVKANVEKLALIKSQKTQIEGLEAKLKEQPKVVYRDKIVPSRPVEPTKINNLLIEARVTCSLRDPLKLPSNIQSAWIVSPPSSYFDGPIGKAYLHEITNVQYQRMEEEGKAFYSFEI